MTLSSELAAVQRRWRPDGPFDLLRTLSPLQRGSGDPTHRVIAGAIWRTLATPAGPATLRLSTRDNAVHALGWGAGAGWAVAGLPDLLGASDDASGFRPEHPMLKSVLRHHPGVHIGRTGTVFDQVVPAILEQKVTGREARQSWRELLLRFGTPAPGPVPAAMRVVPPPRVWLDLPDWHWHRAGVDHTRRRAIRAAASVAGRLEECVDLPPELARRRLMAVPGIGRWTAAEVAQRAFGDADAVSVGDYHIPALVGWALTGQPVDDAGMLALLEEYRPHRHRVVRLIEMSGLGPPRHGPRATIRDYRRM